MIKENGLVCIRVYGACQRAVSIDIFEPEWQPTELSQRLNWV